MPAGLYSITKGTDANPILINHKTAVRTSRQVQAHLLCRDCEHRFNVGGEKWVIENCWRSENQFPLQQGLLGAAPVAVDGATRVYRAAAVPALRVEQFVYFGASVFWRAAVRRWGREDPGNIRFGIYEQPLRGYLLGERTFPDGMAMMIMISASTTAVDNCMMSLPWLAGRRPIHKYRFDIPGVSYGLFVGKSAQTVARSGCAARYGTVVITPEAERQRIQTARTVARNFSIKGKLRERRR